jgi:gag-polyprotein putative aspartyl protease
VTALSSIPAKAESAGSGASCFPGAVVGLDPHGDNNLSVRRAPNGPSGLASEKDELFTGDTVSVCDRVGNWLFVTYNRDGRRFSGWVFSRYIAPTQSYAAPPPAPTYAPSAPAYVPPVYAPPAPSYAPPRPTNYLQLTDRGDGLYASIMIGNIPTTVLIDTGSTHLAITESLADRLLQSGQAMPGPGAIVTLADGSSSAQRTIYIQNVTVAGRVLHGLRAGVGRDVSPLLLGLSVLSSASTKVGIDFETKRLVFE